MNKYKVEIKQTETYVIDVLAKDEAEADNIASKEWEEVNKNGTEHYYQIDITTEVGTIYDVTDTEDPFDPVNCIHSECDQYGDCKACGVSALSTNNGIK